MNNGPAKFWLLVSAVGTVVLMAVAVPYGLLNHDEGWYLYAGRMVAEGRYPFIDFCYTQGPVLPFVYALITPLIAEHGVLAGRIFTAFLGAIAILLSALLAMRMSAPGRRVTAATLVLVMTGLSLGHIYFFSVVKTYSLAALFFLGGLFCVARVADNRDQWSPWIGGLLLGLAAGVRLSAVVALPIVAFYYLFQRERVPRAWLSFGIAAATTVLAIYLPVFLTAPEAVRFGLLEYHSAREGGYGASLLTWKAGFILLLFQTYPVLCLLAGARVLLGERVNGRESEDEPDDHGLMKMLWIVIGSVTLIHFIAPFPYPDYQSFVMPLAAVAVAVSWARFDAEKVGGRLLFGVVCASIAFSASSPLTQSWVMRGMDRIWPDKRAATSLEILRDAADVVRDAGGDTLLTLDTYLAVESGKRVPEGLEMGPFSYMPGLSREQAEERHVVNHEMALELLEKTDAPLAAMSGYAWAIESPSITRTPDERLEALEGALKQRYSLLEEIPDYGQQDTVLKIYRMETSE